MHMQMLPLEKAGLLMDWDRSLKIAQIVAPFLTSITITILGVVIVRRIEGVKAAVSKRAAFEARWADELFHSCQQYERALEQKATILVALCYEENRVEKAKGSRQIRRRLRYGYGIRHPPLAVALRTRRVARHARLGIALRPPFQAPRNLLRTFWWHFWNRLASGV
jgi:hypothetical protein